MDVLVLNRWSIETFHSITDMKYIVISITDEYGAPANIPENNNLLDILRLQFSDINEVIDQYHTIHKFQAESIANLVIKYHDKVDLIVVHCEAGISRSAGCAMAIEEWYWKKPVISSKYPLANRKVYRMVYDALRRKDVEPR